MLRGDSDDTGAAMAPGRTELNERVIMWGVVLCLVLILGMGFLLFSMRSALQGQIAGLEQGTANQIQDVKKEAASLASDISAATDHLRATNKDLEATRDLADTLKTEHDGTVRTAQANAAAVKTIRRDTEAKVTEVDEKVAGVSKDLKTVSADLATARNDLAQNRREMTTVTTKLSDQVAKNVSDLSELRRKSERDFVTFDLRKGSSPETWTVAGIRIELKKTDVKKSKYDVILHVDDRLLEKKDRTMYEPVPFLVGPDKLRYELVVSEVDRDRIRGYVSIPKG